DESEIENFDDFACGRTREKNVLRFDIAMQELATVRFFDSGTDPLEDIERPFHGQKFASVEFCTQRASRQQFHDDERMAAFDADVVNSDHVLMEKARCRARFL